jgi:hypothetical protein
VQGPGKEPEKWRNIVTKTLKIEGEALEVVRELVAQEDRVNADVLAIQEAAQRQRDILMSKLKDKLGLGDSDHCHVDIEYLAEHGVAFARTGCGGGGLSDLLAKIMGGVKAADKPGVR